jgi:hypothetical protein
MSAEDIPDPVYVDLLGGRRATSENERRTRNWLIRWFAAGGVIEGGQLTFPDADIPGGEGSKVADDLLAELAADPRLDAAVCALIYRWRGALANFADLLRANALDDAEGDFTLAWMLCHSAAYLVRQSARRDAALLAASTGEPF